MSASADRRPIAHRILTGVHALPVFIVMLLAVPLVFCCAFSVNAADPTPRQCVVMRAPEHRGPYMAVIQRELIRQSFLITAREEFDVLVWDEFLREGDGKEGDNRHRFALVFIPNPTTPGKMALSSDGSVPSNVLEVTLPAMDDQAVEFLLNMTETWSTKDFREILKARNLPAAQRPSGDAKTEWEPVNAEELLDPFLCLSHLQTLHQALKETPDSPELHAEISLCYVLLGSLTELHWGIESKIFKARGLIYAQRGMRNHPEHAGLAWAKGLALMLTGLHAAAEREVDRARSLPGETPRPDWAPALESFVIWNDQQITENVEKEIPLAAYFQLLAAEMAGTEPQQIAAAAAVLERTPECYRALGSLAGGQELGLRRSAGQAQLVQFVRTFPESMQNFHPLPEGMDELIGEFEDSEGFSDQLEITRDLVAALKASPEQDVRFPPLSTVGMLAENLHFAHALEVLKTERSHLGVDSTETVAQLMPLLEGHPAVDLLGAFRSDTDQARGSLARVAPVLLRLPVGDRSLPILNSLRSLRVPGLDAAIQSAHAHRDSVTPELLRFIEDPNFPITPRRKVIAVLQRVSPNCPAVQNHVISYVWEPTVPGNPEWEQTDNVNTLIALATFFDQSSLVDSEFADRAERCWKKAVAADPSPRLFRSFAIHYLNRGNPQEYRKQMLLALEQPSFGLEHAQISNGLAMGFMRRGDFKTAKPHAMNAAQSYSSWGLETGSQCLEGLGDWKTSEDLTKARAGRYDGDWFEWYLWCRRTGRGDLEGAREHVQQVMSHWEPDAQTFSYERAIYYELESDSEAAIDAWRKITSPRVQELRNIQLALLLQEKGEAEESAKLIAENADRSVFGTASHLCELWRRSIRSGKSEFTEADRNFALSMYPDEKSVMYWAHSLGQILVSIGERDEGIRYLQAVAGSLEVDSKIRALATVQLRKLNAPLTADNMFRYDIERGRKAGEWKRNIEQIRLQGWNKRVKQYCQAMQADLPEWSSGSYEAALQISRIQDYDGAIAQYTKLLESVPDSPGALLYRARLFEKTGQYAKAIADYQHVVTISPDHLIARNNLAWIRAAAPDATVRDAAEAESLAEGLSKQGALKPYAALVLSAVVQAEAGRFDKVEELLRQAQETDPPLPRGAFKTVVDTLNKREPYRMSPQTTDFGHLLIVR